MYGDGWIGSRSGKQAEQQKPDKTPKVTAQAGAVLSVDATKNTIVIKDDAGAEIQLLIGTTTRITRDGKTISLGDVKAGDRVATECEPSADGCKAKSIAVIPPQPSQ